MLKRGAIGAVAAAMSLGLAGCSAQDIARFTDTFKQITGLDRQEDIEVEMGEVPYDGWDGFDDDDDDDYVEELTGEVDVDYGEEDEWELMGDVPYENYASETEFPEVGE